jgi:diaminopimelate decarboxylase
VFDGLIVRKDGRTFFENVILEDLAQRFGTPLYVYSNKVLETQINKAKEALGGLNFDIAYATKANYNVNILKVLKQNGCKIDVVSMGEIFLAQKAGFNPEEMVFNGNGKTPKELEWAIENNIFMLNIDNLEEVELVQKIASNLHKKVNASLRLNPEVEADVHPHDATGSHQSKFGMSFEQAYELLKNAKKYKNIDFIGIHTHIGSQILDFEPYLKTFKKVEDFLKDTREFFAPEFYNIGGGWGIKYRDSEREFDIEKFREKVLPYLKTFKLNIIVELGRYLVAPSAVLLSRVLRVKERKGKIFVVLDAGMNDLIRPALYSAYHEIIPLNDEVEKITVDVVGPLCEDGDFLARDRKIKKVKPGDLVVIGDVGAYGFSMSSNYNARLRAAEILVKNDEAKLIRRRETFEDLIKNQII